LAIVIYSYFFFTIGVLSINFKNMAQYGDKAKKYVEKEMHDYKHKHKWKSRDQAIAVGLSEAREHGGKVPNKD
jgi:hypothetical protein